MNLEQITKLQKQYGFSKMQEQINSGMCWKLEGSVGRAAMQLLESGACMLPTESHRDYYGSKVPSRDELEAGTKGTLKNSINFWTAVANGELELAERNEDEDDY